MQARSSYGFYMPALESSNTAHKVDGVQLYGRVSDLQVMFPCGTTALGPVTPEYSIPLTVRKSHPDSMSKASTWITGGC